MTDTPRYPVVLVAFNRPDVTAHVFERIRQWQPRELYLIIDGPRPDHPHDEELVNQVKSIVSHVDWPCTVHEDFAPTNRGLQNRISSGLTRVFQSAEAAIILEDDCVPNLSFFPFAEELLTRYRDDLRVGLIGGTSRLRGHTVSQYSYDFSSDVRIWGWATWSRTWNTFIESGDLNKSWDGTTGARMLESFPKGARRRAMASMVQAAGRLDSWALPFALHCRSKSYLSVVPEVNLVENIGFGNGSTHTKFEDYVAQVPSARIHFPLRHPALVAENPEVDRLESALDARERLMYPLRHPLDTLGRVWRYVRGALDGR